MIQQLDRYRRACWLAEDAWPGNLAPITLGDRVCLSQGTYICTGPITIGPDSWIAARAVLAPGTVPARAIVRGNPAAVVVER
jgi:putative colanic acid biosynthesis acetyltransferase WcaF